MKVFVSLFTIFLFMGCSATKQEYQNNLASVKNQCTNIKDLKGHTLEYAKMEEFDLGTVEKECVLLDDKTSFALKLLFPPSVHTYEVSIKTKALGGVFAPRILLLDSQSNVKKSYSSETFTFDRGLFKKTFFIDDVKDIKFMVLLRDEMNIEDKEILKVSTTMLSTGYAYFFYSTGDEKVKLFSMPGGKISVTVKEYKPAKATEK